MDALPANQKKKSVKNAGCNEAEHRRRRDEKVVKLRKEKREEGLEKRRKGAMEAADEEPVSPGEVSLTSLSAYCAGASSLRRHTTPTHLTCMPTCSAASILSPD
jgi:hypothetical protein